MGFVDKIKNALFEEVEEEVEEKPEKPKKEKIKKNSVRDKLLRREKEKAKEKENKAKEKPEKPIAQKVVLDDTMDDRVDYHELRDEDFDIEPLQEEEEEKKEEAKPTFTVIDESDLIVDDYVEEKPLIEPSKEEKKDNFDYYDEAKPYGINKDKDIKMHEYGAIAKQEEKSIFRPSPIISPIYGILDKNYKKEDIVNKKDVLITSSYDRRRLSVDDVRKKAYGTISDDLVDDMDKDVPVKGAKEEKKEEDNVLVDLSDDNKKPTVDEVTMGDAEEYYDDLGLEYNVDYVDSAKGKHVKEEVEEAKTEEKKEIKEKKKPVEEKKEEKVEVKEEKKDDNIDDDDDNLFDLIDSMYQEKE